MKVRLRFSAFANPFFRLPSLVHVFDYLYCAGDAGGDFLGVDSLVLPARFAEGTPFFLKFTRFYRKRSRYWSTDKLLSGQSMYQHDHDVYFSESSASQGS